MNRLYICILNLKISCRFVIFLESVRRTCYLLVFLLPSSFPYENISAFRVLRKCCTCSHVCMCMSMHVKQGKHGWRRTWQRGMSRTVAQLVWSATQQRTSRAAWHHNANDICFKEWHRLSNREGGKWEGL